MQYKVVGEPVSLPDAETLAATDPYQFQWWALGLDGARPAEQKKGADKGIDGRRFFNDEAGGKTKQIVYSVKAGHLTPAHVRDLRGVVDRENAAIGVLICMEEPTQQMRAEAASAGFYDSPGWNKKYPKLQILTIAELLRGKRVECPPSRYADATFKKAPREKIKRRKSGHLDELMPDKDDAGRGPGNRKMRSLRHPARPVPDCDRGAGNPRFRCALDQPSPPRNVIRTAHRPLAI